MRQVQQTSVESFYAISEEELGERQRKVYRALLENGPLWNRRLSVILGLPINSITPRVKELREVGLVRCSGKAWDEITNRKVMVWEAVPIQKEDAIG